MLLWGLIYELIVLSINLGLLLYQIYKRESIHRFLVRGCVAVIPNLIFEGFSIYQGVISLIPTLWFLVLFVGFNYNQTKASEEVEYTSINKYILVFDVTSIPAYLILTINDIDHTCDLHRLMIYPYNVFVLSVISVFNLFILEVQCNCKCCSGIPRGDLPLEKIDYGTLGV
jgi:hypothetical protein